jgi:hypothetical protein
MLLLAACGTPTPGVTSKGALDAFKPIASSPKDTCQTQEEIAEHNSRYDTIKTGKEVVYKAPCRVDPPKPEPQRVASSSPKSQ